MAFVIVFASIGGYFIYRSFATSPISAYDNAILADHPVAYWAMNQAGGTEPDLTGNNHAGTYEGGTPSLVSMPNGDRAVDFNGSSEYLTIPSSSAFSIPTTGELTWEGWIRPDNLQPASSASSGYVDWMGKCENYSPTCEWESRMYNSNNPQDRCNRLSAYVFNNTAGLGSGADWQPNCDLLEAGQWLYVVGEYQTLTTPSGCSTADPGTINIWVNGVEWDQAAHAPTGCMSQYGITPTAGDSPLNIGTMAVDTWFQGAVGKIALYDYLLSQPQINAHFEDMTGAAPSGSCATTCTIPVPTQTGTVAPSPPDTTPPSVSLSTPVNGATVSGTLSVSGTASDSAGVSSVELYVDGQLVATDANAPYNFSLNTTKYANGPHSLYLEAFDTVGNHADSATITVTVDNSIASGGGGSSSGGGSTGGTTTTKTVLSSGGLTVRPTTPGTKVSIVIDGKPIEGDTVNTSQLTNGTHTLTITEDGETTKQIIKVHNSLPIALRNYMRAHSVAVVSSAGLALIVALLVFWVGPRSLLDRLRASAIGRLIIAIGPRTKVRPK